MGDDAESADIEHRFPHWVDTSAAQSSADRRFVAMVKWCSDHCKADAWICCCLPERRRGATSTGHTRFYFREDADAAAFRREWRILGQRRRSDTQ